MRMHVLSMNIDEHIAYYGIDILNTLNTILMNFPSD